MIKMADGTDKSLCPTCKKTVENSEDGLQCDAFCDRWHHINCVNINSKQYKKIKELGDAVKWICVVCAGKLETMRSQVVGAEDYTNIHNMVGNLVKIVKDITTDNIAISKRIDQLSDNQFQLNQTVSNLSESMSTKTIHSIENCEKFDKSMNRQSNKLSITINDMNEYASTSSGISTDPTTDFDSVLSPGEQRKNCEFPSLPSQPTGSAPEIWKIVKNKKNQKKNYWKRNSSPQKNNATVGRNYDYGGRVDMVVGTRENLDDIGLVAGDKKAWLYLGRVKKDTSAESVNEFIMKYFPGVDARVEKLQTKSDSYSSFRLCKL